jgi:hypothetical protein
MAAVGMAGAVTAEWASVAAGRVVAGVSPGWLLAMVGNGVNAAARRERPGAPRLSRRLSRPRPAFAEAALTISVRATS